MARHLDAADLDDDLTYVRRPRSKGGALGWVLFVLLLAGAGAFVWYLYLPLRAQRADLQHQLQTEGDKARLEAKKAKESEARFAALNQKQEELSGQLVQSVAEKEKIEAELKRVQVELGRLLEPEIQAGDVRLVRRGNDLVVDLTEQILFDSGQSELNERGQKVLGQVAISLVLLTDYNVHVGGHTDSAPITAKATLEKFPTNWELSTARATTVVRFLQERGNIPGTRLAAVGFAQFRPVARNDTPKGRQMNRRIELTLQRTAGVK